MQKILLKAGKIFNGEDFIKADLLIENGVISAIGDIDEKEAIEIDCTDSIITSGLVDIHTHFSEMGNKQFGYPAEMSTIPFGVTYAVDGGALHSNLAVLDNLLVETKVFVPIFVQDGDINYTALEQVLKSYGDRAIGIKIYFDATLNNGTTECVFEKACEYARKNGLKVMVHCSYSPVPMEKIVETLSTGDIVTHAYHGENSAIYENDYIAYKKAKEKGVIIDVGMAGSCHTDFEVLKNAIKFGYIPDVISTDITKFSAYVRGGIYGLPMCMSIARILGMAEEDVFKAVTINAAKAVNCEDNWFRIKVNDIATLSVIKWCENKIDIIDKAQNKVESTHGYACKLTIKNGQIIYRV